MTEMLTIYDLRADQAEIKRVQEIVKEGRTRYRTKWGLFGTKDWWDRLNEEQLIQKLSGVISRVYMSGHNDYPEFEISCQGQKYSFARIGDDESYEVGKKAEVECIESQYIQPASDLTLNVLQVLSLRIEE